MADSLSYPSGSFHDSQLINGIYLYCFGCKINGRWIHNNSKVHSASSDTNELLKQISRNLTNSTIVDISKSHSVVTKRPNDCTDISHIDNPWRKRTKTEPGMY